MSNRIEDDEVLFTTLILMEGEPPTPPKLLPSGNFNAKLEFAVEMRQYSIRVKNMMAELEHEPNQGLFTSYIHWAREQWNAKQHEQKGAEAEARKA